MASSWSSHAARTKLFSLFVAISFCLISVPDMFAGRCAAAREIKQQAAAAVSLPSNETGTLHKSSSGELISVPAEDARAERVGVLCKREDMSVSQGASNPLPDGIPTYTVEIVNVCATGCSISNIHVSCGWFSSARLVNPKIFRRLRFNDCLVNDGKPLKAGSGVSFEYANSFKYPLSVSSVGCAR